MFSTLPSRHSTVTWRERVAAAAASWAPARRDSSTARRASSRVAGALVGLPTAASDGDRGHADRRHALRHRHRLAVLAAGPAALVDGEVVGDHVHLLEDLGAVADDVDVLDRPGELAILDEEAVLHVEGEVAGADLYLAVGERRAVDALLHRPHDLVVVVRPVQHVGRAHARQRRELVALAAAVAGGL